jgi:hypothetical protein
VCFEQYGSGETLPPFSLISAASPSRVLGGYGRRRNGTATSRRDFALDLLQL